MNKLQLSKQTARRYLLGRQGLWPGRRWQGKSGVAQAITQMEAVQIDTVVVVARSHDIALWSRVAGYDKADLDSLIHEDRAFFDYGSILMVYPMSELPYWQPIMGRDDARSLAARVALESPDIIDLVRRELRERGPLGARDIEGSNTVSNGRSRKDSGLMLYHLWTRGELMSHSRRNFERVYDFRENIAPPEHSHAATLAEAEAHFATKALRDTGLNTARGWADRLGVTLHRSVGIAEAKRLLPAMVEAGLAASAALEGSKDTWYFPAADIDLITRLDAGEVPADWQPVGTSTADEITIIAPLDNVIWDRTRTQAVFDFDYVWEIYKPAEKRRWGYYTLPILYGDRLVARLDPKMDRAKGVLKVLGFWLEDDSLEDDPAFAAALMKGIANFARFNGAKSTDLSAIPPALIAAQPTSEAR